MNIQINLTYDEVIALLTIADRIDRCAACKRGGGPKPIWSQCAFSAWEKLREIADKEESTQ